VYVHVSRIDRCGGSVFDNEDDIIIMQAADWSVSDLTDAGFPDSSAAVAASSSCYRHVTCSLTQPPQVHNYCHQGRQKSH